MVAESLFKDRYSHRFATILNHDFPRKTPHRRHSGIMGARPCYRRAHFRNERQGRRDARPRIGLCFGGKNLARKHGPGLVRPPRGRLPRRPFQRVFRLRRISSQRAALAFSRKKRAIRGSSDCKPLRSHRRNSSDFRPHALLRPGRLGGRHRCGNRRRDTCLRRDQAPQKTKGADKTPTP